MRSLLLSVSLALGAAWSVQAVEVDAATFAKENFDFLVVGAGTAGVALAVRLSEVPSFHVGLIEAGNYHKDDPKILVPNAYLPTWQDPEYDWRFNLTPQKKLDNRVFNLVRGKGVGGCSQINNLGYVRPGAVEYDLWGQLGNPGWTWNTTLHYMKKIENHTFASPEIQRMTFGTSDPRFRGNSGPIHTSYASWYSAAILPFYYAMERLGLKPVQDGGNGIDGEWVGNAILSINQDTQTRSYAANDYYEPNSRRSNLVLLTGAQATKINFNSKKDKKGNLVATGIEYVELSSGKKYTARASREVLLTAGAVQSPQLMELSGIGNKTLLSKFGIKTILENPNVGEGYQDHLQNRQTFEVPDSIQTFDEFFIDPEKNATDIAQYNNEKFGPYVGGIDSWAFMSARQFLDDKTVQKWLHTSDAELNATNPTPLARLLHNVNKGRMQKTSREAVLEVFAMAISAVAEIRQKGHSYMMMSAIPQHPFSRGWIHIGSSDPLAAPILELNTFGLTIDRNVFIESAKYIRKIVGAPEYKPLIVDYVVPTRNVTTDAQWQDYIEQRTDTPDHPCCTAAMLPKELNGVTDPKLLVYGTANLRVVDLSVLPFLLGQHLMSTAYVIGEHGADIIKQKYAPEYAPKDIKLPARDLEQVNAVSKRASELLSNAIRDLPADHPAHRVLRV